MSSYLSNVYIFILHRIKREFRLERKESELFDALKAGSESSISQVYDLYRDEFINWCNANYSTDDTGAADLFQDAIIAFYYNIRKGTLSELNSSMKTYLFAIGKNLALKKLKKESKMVVDEQVLELNSAFIQNDLFEEDDKKRVVAELMKQLGEPCKSLLQLFYFERFTMDSIAERLGYKNENVAKSQKLRCFNNLKNMVLQRFSQDDI